MKTIKDFYYIHRGFVALMLFSLFIGLVFFFTNNLDFIIEALNQEKYTFSNTAYSLLKVIIGILLPWVFIIPTHDMGRIKSARLLFIVYGAMYIITLSWIPVFFRLGAEDMIAFQSSMDNSYVASILLWDTYSWAGSIFSFIFGLLCIITGFSIDDHKNKVRWLVMALPISKLLLPIINNIATGNGILSVLWITNNYAEILALMAFAGAFNLAARFDDTWVRLIWNQEPENNTYDEI